MSTADELEKLEELHRRGALTDEEFAQAKALVLGVTPRAPATAGGKVDPTVDPERDLTQRLRVMQILAFGLLGGLVVFLAISLFIVLVTNNGQGLAPPQPPVLSVVAWVMLPVCGLLSFLIPRMVTQAGLRQMAAGTWQVPPGGDPAAVATAGSQLLMLRQTTLIVGLAQLEGAAFTGCIAYLVEGQLAVLLVPGVVILLMLGTFPTEGRIRAWLERQAEVLAELRRQEPGAGGRRER
jgi:hypothetical protein